MEHLQVFFLLRKSQSTSRTVTIYSISDVMLMRVTDENQTIADAQISISQEEEMDMIICDKSDVTYYPETKCMYPCTLSITCGLFWQYEPNNQTSVLNLCQLPRPLLGTP